MTLERFADDVRFCHRRRWPDRRLGILSVAVLLIMSPGLWTMMTYRLTHWWAGHRARGNVWRSARWVVAPPMSLLDWLTKVICKNDVQGSCEIDGGVYIADEGHVICGAEYIGAGTVVGPRTTIGMRLADRGLPTIGRNVWIGADCVVYGHISIGDGATLLPNTVVTRDVPTGAVVEGNPARLRMPCFDNTVLRERPSIDTAEALSTVRGQ